MLIWDLVRCFGLYAEFQCCKLSLEAVSRSRHDARPSLEHVSFVQPSLQTTARNDLRLGMPSSKLEVTD